MIKTIIKGIFIGVANIIPGVSGGTMAVSMGIYDKLIHALTHLFSEFKKSMKLLIPILIGAAIALIAGAKIIGFLFENYPMQTNFLFIGLIIGGLPAIVKKVKGVKVHPGHILAFLLFFVLVVGMALLGEKEGNAVKLTVDAASMIKMFGVGVIASATMVIPGVSGSMILMLMGYYNSVIQAINDFMHALVTMDMDGILNGFGILAPMGVGIVVGIFVIAKIIEIIFAKAPNVAFYAIIGLIVASPFSILIMSGFGAVSVMSIITSAAALIAGSAVAYKLGE